MRRVTSDADLAVACPLCHAQPGRPCGWKGAVYAGVVHRERKREAECSDYPELLWPSDPGPVPDDDDIEPLHQWRPVRTQDGV